MPTFRIPFQVAEQFSATVQSFARAGFEIHLRSTRRYGEASDPPHLYQNSPLLLAVARLPLPGINDQVVAVLDSPIMTIQRSPRDREVSDLLETLLELCAGSITYGTEPVELTSELDADEAARWLAAGESAALTPDTVKHLLSLLR